MEHYFMTQKHNRSLVPTPQKHHRHMGGNRRHKAMAKFIQVMQEFQLHLELEHFLTDGIFYYLLPSPLWLMNLITWSSEFNNSKGKCTARPSGFRFSFYLHQ